MAHFDHYKQLLFKLNKQREIGFLCDCTIVIGEFQFRAHRNVLASFSEYFRALFEDALDSIVLLHQNQVTPTGFQTLLDFIYSGNLNYESCNIKEIHQAAEYLRLEDVVSTCKSKMEYLVVVARSCVTNLPITKVSMDSNAQSSLRHPGDETNTDKIEPVCPQVESKKVITGKKASRNRRWKKTIRSPQKVHQSSVQFQNPTPVITSELGLDVDKLAVGVTEQVIKDNCLLPLTSTIDCESFLTQDSVHIAHEKQKHTKCQQDCALKEHCMSNIASVCNMEGMENDLDDKYSKNKPVCNTCGKVFSEASSLRRHMRIHKGVKPYECHLCGKAFTQCNQLKTHVRTHTGEKPYQCKLCDKGFAQKCQLVFHSRMHHGEEKPYKCDACNLQFATSSNLKIHSRKHSGEKPYVCDRCGQRFAQASTLTYHVRRHTGEKPYVCDTCGKAFAVSSSLITHARKHTGEKPYICGVCGKSFISSGELNKHFRSHTGERPFVCELCGNSYTDVKNLKKHKLKMHNGSEKSAETETMDNTLNDEDTTEKSLEQDQLDLKPSELFLPLTLHISPEDSQTLLPVTDNQCLSSDTLLRTSVTSYSEPQFIFLHQMY
ncbi:myoneurin [Rhinophrynus dorsalis]